MLYNLIEYSDNYSKTSGILRQYCRNEQALEDDDAITDFNAANAITNLFKIKEKITGPTGNSGTKNVEIIVKFKYLSIFWRILKMLLSSN